MAFNNILCFRPGCNHSVDSVEQTIVTRKFPTRGSLGCSTLEIAMYFCSPRCEVVFFEHYDTPKKLWRLLTKLVQNALKTMPKPRRLTKKQIAEATAAVSVA
jgi:hypothetical protein